MKHLKKLHESALNEATYVKGKHDNIMKDIDKLVEVIKQNVEDSPDYEKSKPVSDKALTDIDKAYEDFKAALAAAIKPVGQNYTGA